MNLGIKNGLNLTLGVNPNSVASFLIKSQQDDSLPLAHVNMSCHATDVKFVAN